MYKYKYKLSAIDKTTQIQLQLLYNYVGQIIIINCTHSVLNTYIDLNTIQIAIDELGTYYKL